VIKGLIFDFDGLLVDTESSAYDSWIEIYREHDCELPLSLWAVVLGGSGKEFDPCSYLEEQIGRPLDQEALRARRWQRKLELVATQPLLPGVIAYLDQAKALGLKVGVASSSSRKWVVGHLDRLEVTYRCDAIICSDDVTHVKPDPEIYTTALAALDLCPEEAIAFEDAPNGLLAAHRAGLYCVAVPNSLTRQLPLIHADLRLVSLEEMPLSALLTHVQPI
jgi:HAD superfamily hydrolase (TIGR01509 family)